MRSNKWSITLALKLLSGILVVSNTQSGTATIDFTRHHITGNVHRTRSRRQTMGPIGSFKDAPCYIVVPREFKVVEAADFKDHPGNEDHGLFDRIDDPTEHDKFTINSNITKDGLEIFWHVASFGDPRGRPRSQSRIYEISYMVAGEV